LRPLVKTLTFGMFSSSTDLFWLIVLGSSSVEFAYARAIDRERKE